MAVNPALPPIPEPLAEIQALVAVTRALKQRVEALTASVGVLSQGGTIVPPAGSTGGSGGGGGGGATYILPVASTITLGGVMVDGTSVTMSGPVLSASATGPAPADTAPLMSGLAMIGVSAKYARMDHKHPHDTSNPEGYQTASEVALSIASSAYHLTAAAWGALDLSTLPTSDPGGGKPWLNGGVVQVGP